MTKTSDASSVAAVRPCSNDPQRERWKKRYVLVTFCTAPIDSIAVHGWIRFLGSGCNRPKMLEYWYCSLSPNETNASSNEPHGYGSKADKLLQIGMIPNLANVDSLSKEINKCLSYAGAVERTLKTAGAMEPAMNQQHLGASPAQLNNATRKRC